MEFAVTIFLLLFIGWSIIKLCREYKMSKTISEKTLFWLIIAICFIPLIIYYVDRYDLPSRFGFLKNNDAEKWFNFISTYVASILGATIGGVTMVLIAILQIRTQNKSNKEDKRIQNAPVLKYDISNEKVDDAKRIYLINADGDIYNIYFNIENVGLNHARHLRIEIHEDSTNLYRTYDIDGQQSILKQSENICLDLIFNFKYNKKDNENNKKNIKIDVYYEDLLKNKYKQCLDMLLVITDDASSRYGGYKFIISKIDINDEEYLNEWE